MRQELFTLTRRLRVQYVVMLAVSGLILFGWAIGVGDVETSDMGSVPYRVFAGLLSLAAAGMALSELIGLRNTEIVVSEDGISTPHGLGRRESFVRWEELAQVEVFSIRGGEILALTRRDGSVVRIGLREVDRPTDLVAAVKGRLDRYGEDPTIGSAESH